ncbi:MAG: hypothetical protein HYV07_17630 [Deltaproteobacteria bacterium]|nr:hypothetical protein [Deltaproteobacteria bacterium]
MSRIHALVIASAIGLFAGSAAAACKPGQVHVKGKTPIYRGPGLNYPVAQFLEGTKCLRLGEVSLDEKWVRVESDSIFGWVLATRLDGASRATLSQKSPTSAPVGKGQERSYVVLKRATPGLKKPGGPKGRTLLAGERLVPLAIDETRELIEARDERGAVSWIPVKAVEDEHGAIAALPVSSGGLLDTVESDPDKLVDDGRDGRSRKGVASLDVGATSSSSSSLVNEGPGPALPEPSPRAGLALEARLLAGPALPAHSLDSNATAGQRRYDITALAPVARIEVLARPLGLLARVSYGFEVLAGLATEAAPNNKIGARSHEARMRLGVPIEVGFELTPELGYAFRMVDIDPAFPGTLGGQFVSARSHLGTLGAGARIGLAEGLSLDLELSGALGVTEEYPFDLGRPSLSAGFFGALGFAYALTDSVGMIVRWDARFVTTSFEGVTPFDETMTSASLAALDQALLVGASFAL